MRHDDLEIAANSVHVWIARLPTVAPLLGDRRSLLGETELRRLDRLKDGSATEGYLTAHALFRHLMSGYLKVAPETVYYKTGPLGAPLPLQSAGGRCFCWSLSYRGEYAAYAISASGPVGVDIERIRSDAAEEVAEQCMKGAERAAVDSLVGAERERRIFQHWSIKEAVLKRAGIGLSIPPDEVGVDLTDLERPAIIASKPRGEELSEVAVRCFEAPEGYVGAVAADPGLSDLLVLPLEEQDLGGQTE